MAIPLPSRLDTSAEDYTPRQIVQELDRYIVGQNRAKRAVAIALRNRIRRQKLPPSMAEEIAPKNIIMIGPTGIGKTELHAGLQSSFTLRSSKWKPPNTRRSVMSGAMWNR